jgi:hypothetical protein
LEIAPHSQFGNRASFSSWKSRLILNLEIAPHSQFGNRAPFPIWKSRLILKLEIAPHSDFGNHVCSSNTAKNSLGFGTFGKVVEVTEVAVVAKGLAVAWETAPSLSAACHSEQRLQM